VRAAEVELDAIATGVFHHRQDALPGILLAWNHQRNDQRPIRPVAFDLSDLLEVDAQRPVGDELDVVETDQRAVQCIQRTVARTADIDDGRILTQRLPHHTAPSRFECAIDVVSLVGGRRRSQPERVR